MQAYHAGFARIYNMRWGGFAQSVAPKIMDFYAATPIGQNNRAMLDVCCGTGQMAAHFLNAGYHVVGLDASKPMLDHARENTQSFVEAGQARFIQGDAGRFTLDERFGLVVSTFDALNHLEDEEHLMGCFQSVFAVLAESGLFVFDLNTAVGLRRWNAITIDDSSDDLLIINRGIYDEQSRRAWTRITGFVRAPDGLYERFDENAFNTVFDLGRVKDMLLDAGWREVHFAHIDALQIPLAEPEKEGRVFIVAGK